MIGSQFHPEFLSRPNRPHPMFVGLIEAAVAFRDGHKTPKQHKVPEKEL
jgi:CTP synthase